MSPKLHIYQKEESSKNKERITQMNNSSPNGLDDSRISSEGVSRNDLNKFLYEGVSRKYLDLKIHVSLYLRPENDYTRRKTKVSYFRNLSIVPSISIKRRSVNVKSIQYPIQCLMPKIWCFSENFALSYFSLTALHSADKFSREQQICGLNKL